MFLAFLLAVAATTPPPFDMAPYFAGSLRIEQLGETDRMAIRADGRYLILGQKIPRAEGRWWFETDQFCVLPDPQPGVADQKVCMALEARKAGESWTKTFGDQTVRFTLTADQLAF